MDAGSVAAEAEAEAVLAWATDRCEVVAHRYRASDEALSDAADRCKDAVRALSPRQCPDGLAACKLAIVACEGVASSVWTGHAVAAVRECAAAISQWPDCRSWHFRRLHPK